MVSAVCVVRLFVLIYLMFCQRIACLQSGSYSVCEIVFTSPAEIFLKESCSIMCLTIQMITRLHQMSLIEHNFARLVSLLLHVLPDAQCLLRLVPLQVLHQRSGTARRQTRKPSLQQDRLHAHIRMCDSPPCVTDRASLAAMGVGSDRQ